MMNCGKPSACSDADINALPWERPWGVNNPRWSAVRLRTGLRPDRDRHRRLALLRHRVGGRRSIGERQQHADRRRAAGEPGSGQPHQSWRRHHQPAGDCLRPGRHAAGHRHHRRAHRHHRNRARLHRAARTGRAEPPRPQGCGPDARQGVRRGARWAPRATSRSSRRPWPTNPRHRSCVASSPPACSPWASDGRHRLPRSSIRCCSSRTCRRTCCSSRHVVPHGPGRRPAPTTTRAPTGNGTGTGKRALGSPTQTLARTTERKYNAFAFAAGGGYTASRDRHRR